MLWDENDRRVSCSFYPLPSFFFFTREPNFPSNFPRQKRTGEILAVILIRPPLLRSERTYSVIFRGKSEVLAEIKTSLSFRTSIARARINGAWSKNRNHLFSTGKK